MVVWSAAKRDNQTHDDQSGHDNDFYRGQYEFGLAKRAHMKDLMNVSNFEEVPQGDITLIATMITPKIVIQIATLRSGLQYLTTRPAAVRFVGVARQYLKK